jgi:DNA-binding NarL/FixJ family response regulator
MRRTRVLLADDHEMICAGFRKLLEPEYDVIGSVADGLALLRAAAELKPDVVLVDIGMPLLNGLDAGRELKKGQPIVKIVFLTMNPDPDVAIEALRIGASGYLLKTSQGEELLKAMHQAMRGMSYVTPQVRQAMEDSFVRNPTPSLRTAQLTSRQLEILQMLAEGKSMKEIAYVLDISFRTVRFHKYRVMEELKVTTNAEIVQYAIKHAIIFPQ